MNLLEFFQYGFVVRGFTAGVIIALVAPLIGIFLVLRRYSLIADTLAHVSFAGVALGFLLGVNPVVTTLAATLGSSVIIERLRQSKRLSGDAALSLFLSGSLAVATVLLSLKHGFSVNLTNYLFGSIVTVTENDVWVIAGLAAVVAAIVTTFFKEFVAIAFDEDTARVGGIPVNRLNILLIILAALTVALAIPIIGILLTSALMIIPVLAALQFRRGFVPTLMIAEAVSLISVIAGMLISFAFTLASGGTIVLVALFLFALSALANQSE